MGAELAAVKNPIGQTGRLHLAHNPVKGLWGRHLPSWDPSTGGRGRESKQKGIVSDGL